MKLLRRLCLEDDLSPRGIQDKGGRKEGRKGGREGERKGERRETKREGQKRDQVTKIHKRNYMAL
jgi:hypothetical protein